MFARNLLRRSSCVPKYDDTLSEHNKLEMFNFKRLSADNGKVISTIISATIFSVGLIYNELKKLRRDIKPLHDIFDFEKKLDTYILAPNYSVGSPPKVSFAKKCLKDLMANKSIWDAIPTKTLLKCTHSKDITIQRKARDVLSRRQYTEGDCWVVSQAIDFQTSLYLARTPNVDRRLFRPPFKLPPSGQSIETELTNLVDCMPRTNNMKDHQKFIDMIRKRKIHASSHIDKTVMLGFDTFDEMGSDSQRSLHLHITHLLLQAALKYSQDTINCNYLIDNKVLMTLRRAYEEFQEDRIVMTTIIKILNNIILCGADPKLLFETGWFHIIVKWLDSKCENILSNSSKLLINMDLSHKGQLKQAYDNHVFPIYPIHHHRNDTKADVVFIHGLRGGAVKTWRQRDRKPINIKNNNNNNKHNNHNNPTNTDNNNCTASNGDTKISNDVLKNVVFVVEEGEVEDSKDWTQCWPKDWLSQDVDNVRILSVEYDTKLTKWTSNDNFEKKTLREQADILLNSLSAVGVGKKPVVFVGHSMGGLLIKQMLCMASERGLDLANQVKGILFYSVPHRGSNLVNRTRNASYIFHPTDAVLQLAEGSADLKDLHDQFSYLMMERSIKMRSFTEGKTTNLPFYMKATIVSQQSSDPGFGDFFIMKDHDHVTICKPKSKDSLLYILTRDFIKNCLLN